MLPQQNELVPLPEGKAMGVTVYNNNGGGLLETMADVMAVCTEEAPDFKRQVLANYIATFGELKIDILPGEVEAIRKHYGF